MIELYEGIAETGVPVVGGDLTSSDAVMLSVTALGRSERVPGRGGALPGDLLVVTGPLGRAGAAFRQRSYARFPMRLTEGRRLAATAHAMLDISDGIAVDAGHIARRSGVKCVVELRKVPLAPGATVADLAHGEDYELLAAVAEPDGFPVVGRVEEGEGVELLLDGRAARAPRLGALRLELEGLDVVLARPCADHRRAQLPAREHRNRRQ